MSFILKWVTKNVPFPIIFALLILFFGIIALGFTYVLSPTLVPGYGAGEPFQLTKFNNYTFQLPWYSKSRIHLTITANDSINIFIDGINVYNGSNYVTSIEPDSQIVVNLQANSPVSGKFHARQEPLWFMELISISTFLFGFVLSFFVLSISYLSARRNLQE